jgi:hypothetical protein
MREKEEGEIKKTMSHIRRTKKRIISLKAKKKECEFQRQIKIKREMSVKDTEDKN